MDTLRLLSRSSGLRFNQAQQSRNQALPSAGGSPTNVLQTVNGSSSGSSSGSSKKRKHDDLESDKTQMFADLDEPAIRKLQKQHKIKITDLRALHHDHARSSSSNSAPETRKANKEAARLFPQPLQSFSQLQRLGVKRALLANIADQAYKEPTEVQIATIPLLLRRGEEAVDLLTVAPTGSGKTLAFLVPLIEKIRRARKDGTEKGEEGNGGRHVSALILAPTKELVGQIVNEGKKLAGGTGVRITEMRKGMRLLADEGEDNGEDEARELESDDDSNEEEDRSTKATVVKADMLVSTPLSLVNAIARKDSTVLPLPHIHTLILDEADYLLDPLFRDQVLSIWAACTLPELQTSLWSATIGSSIEELAISTITARYTKRSKKTRSLIRTIIGLKDTSLPTISHKLVYASTESGKLMGLRQLLHPAPSSTKGSTTASPVLRPPFLIFTQTIPRATALHSELKYDIPASAGGSSRIAVLHSNLSNTQRAKTMMEFRQGKIWILITTDLLSRGVDFRGINGVVNYDIPTTAASYVHRAGRTGRAGREGGICVTYYTREDIRYLKPIANLISASEKSPSSAKTASNGGGGDGTGMPSWLLAALPALSKQDRKELKQRGVDVRRGVKESDDKDERRRKGKNRIGTSSGYERQLEDRRKGMVEGSRRRKQKEKEEDEDDGNGGFEGFDD